MKRPINLALALMSMGVMVPEPMVRRPLSPIFTPPEPSPAVRELDAAHAKQQRFERRARRRRKQRRGW